MNFRFNYRLFATLLSLICLLITPLPVFGRRTLNHLIDLVFQSPTRWIRQTLFPSHTDFDGFYTDSLNYGILLFFGLLLTTAFYVVITKIDWKITLLLALSNKIVIYLLAWVFLVYGFSKILGNQFPDLSHLSIQQNTENKDIIFWAWMGSHPFIVNTLAFIEIGIASSLFFQRTRKIGLILFNGMISGILATNVVYNIGVVMFSLVLLFSAITSFKIDQHLNYTKFLIPENTYKSLKFLVVIWIFILAGFHNY